MSLVSIERRQTPSTQRGESVSPRYREERDSFFTTGGECLSSVSRGGRLLLYIEERASLLYIERRETPSLENGERVSLFYINEEGGLLSILLMTRIKRTPLYSSYGKNREEALSRAPSLFLS